VRSAKLKITRMDLRSLSIREYRMERTGDSPHIVRTAVTRTAARTATAPSPSWRPAPLVAGGVAAARTLPASAPVAVPDRPDRPDLGPRRAAGQHRRVEPGLVTTAYGVSRPSARRR
jgi:hypothetical protein